MNEKTGLKLNQYDHRCLYYIFSLRPIASEKLPAETTNAQYCLYDTTHDDYVYTQEWVEFLIVLLTQKGFTVEKAAANFKAKTKIDITIYE